MAPARIEWAERMVVLWNEGEIEIWLDEIGTDCSASTIAGTSG